MKPEPFDFAHFNLTAFFSTEEELKAKADSLLKMYTFISNDYTEDISRYGDKIISWPQPSSTATIKELAMNRVYGVYERKDDL